tara:strand:+ start:653 stop:823 length:171 start_codon:yes stop_codon:yes gene_type:complete
MREQAHVLPKKPVGQAPQHEMQAGLVFALPQWQTDMHLPHAQAPETNLRLFNIEVI